MIERCERRFEESLLSGYLDGALTQSDRQRVRLHLEECAVCRLQLAEMEQLREVTMNTRFQLPSDDQWDERSRTRLGRFSLGLGWALLLIWLVGVVGFVLGQIWNDSHSVLEKLLVFGGVSGVALIFLSVLLDRLRTLKTDRYREVKK